MKYIEYLSEWKFSLLWIEHSVFLKDGKVLSYEPSPTLGKWKFVIYNESEWVDDVMEIRKEIDMEDIDIELYEGMQLDWVCCFEALELIHNNMSETIKKRVIRITFTSVAIFLLLLFTHWVAIVFWIALHEAFFNYNYNVEYIITE